jgi:hypothetical protein
VPVYLSIPSGYDKVELLNVTDYIAHAATVIKAVGRASAPAGSAYLSTGSGANPNVMTDTILLTAGFTFLADSGDQTPGPAVVNAAGITAATPAVASTTTPLAVGDIARVYNSTGMLQISMDFTVTAIAAGVSQTYGFLPAAGFAAPATAHTFRKIPFDARFYPRRRFITAISAANPAVIQLSVLHDLVVGEQVRIYVPAAFGMTQMDGQLATITAVTNTIGTGTNSITVNVDSTAFTAFAFPTSAVAATGITFPQVVPVGESATYQSSFDDATLNKSVTGVKIDTGVLVASKVYSWIATKGTAI